MVAHQQIVLTAKGPTPSVLKTTAGGLSPLWVNQDGATHTVTFANGRCSVQLAPGEKGECSDDFFLRVGKYPYSVDGTIQASVVVALNSRTVTMTTSRHILTRGAWLALRGELNAAHPTPGASLQPVIVLARHDSNHPFHRVAVVRPRAVGSPPRAIWQLRVRPLSTTTYKAVVNYQPGYKYWQSAASRPLRVIVRN